MRVVALAVLLPFAAACTSTSGVPGGGVGAIRYGIVTDREGHEVRIDPNSEARFERTDGTWTAWRSASELWVSDDGVVVPYATTIKQLDRVRVDALTPADLIEVQNTAGADDKYDYDGDSIVLSGDLGPWLTRFVNKHPTDAPSGTWSFHSTAGVWFDGIGGAGLPHILREGIVGHDGLRWVDITSAEVRNLSGGKTLVAVVAVSAVAVGLVAVAVLTKGKALELPFKAGSSVAEATARGAVHVAVRLPAHCCSGGGGGSKPKPAVVASSEDQAGLGKPGYELPATNGAYRLFDGVDRRRASYRIGAALDFGAPIDRRHAWSAGAVPMLRITDLFEIGGGLRLLGRGQSVDRVWLGRVGLHAELDARRRFALPFSLDFGGSSTVSFHARLNFGLRVRVVDAWSIGLYPVNPTYTRLRTQPLALSGAGQPEPVPHWSFPTTIETSFTF